MQFYCLIYIIFKTAIVNHVYNFSAPFFSVSTKVVLYVLFSVVENISNLLFHFFCLYLLVELSLT